MRVYEQAAARGAKSFLVGRLWPRGVRKEALHFDAWLKDVAPSDSLRRWFHHDVRKWREFQKRYRSELDSKEQAWAPLAEAASRGDVVLLYSSRDPEHNNAVALRDYLEEKLARPAPVRARKR